MKRYYFDYAAATPLDRRVKKAMEPYWSEKFGNPGALHWFGQEASAAVFKARDTIAKALGCDYREIIFTGSATEANNLALRGVVRGLVGGMAARIDKNQLDYGRLTKTSYDTSGATHTIKPKIIVSAVEHESVLETARDLEKDGIEAVYLPVDKNGLVDLKKLEAALDERTILVSVMYVNNEVGTIQSIAKISEIIRKFRSSVGGMAARNGMAKRKTRTFNDTGGDNYNPHPLFHCDAVQAFNYLPCNVDELGVDLMTLSAQKIYGPKGVGALYARQSEKRIAKSEQRLSAYRPSLLAPIITGGSQQEYGLRGGTENVPAIVGFGKAVELAEKFRDLEYKRLRRLQKYFLAKIEKIAPSAELNGPLPSPLRIPNNINLYFANDKVREVRKNPQSPLLEQDVPVEDLLIKLDLAGFAVSPGAACTARACQPSRVLKALGYSDERAAGNLRFTFGRPTTKAEVDKLLEAIKKKL